MLSRCNVGVLIWNTLIGLLIILISGTGVEAQKDSLLIHAEVGINGRWQTGNLNQFGILPRAGLGIANKHFSLESEANYQYLRVEGFGLVNDLWVGGAFKIKPQNRIYPMVFSMYGFAQSYLINKSFVLGIGGGVNIIKKSPLHYLRANLTAGYLDFEFEGEPAHTAPAAGAMIESSFPLGERGMLSWKLNTYYSLSDLEYWGANNTVILGIKILKDLSVHLNHSTIFNNKTVPTIEKINTLMLFGVAYQINRKTIRN